MGERKAAVVTGSTSGIGLAIATAYAKSGMDVMLNGLGDAAEIEKIRSGLAKDAGVTVFVQRRRSHQGRRLRRTDQLR